MSFCDLKRAAAGGSVNHVFPREGSSNLHIETVAWQSFAVVRRARDFGGRYLR
jgi:hypothetical protein